MQQKVWLLYSAKCNCASVIQIQSNKANYYMTLTHLGGTYVLSAHIHYNPSRKKIKIFNEDTLLNIQITLFVTNKRVSQKAIVSSAA